MLESHPEQKLKGKGKTRRPRTSLDPTQEAPAAAVTAPPTGPPPTADAAITGPPPTADTPPPAPPMTDAATTSAPAGAKKLAAAEEAEKKSSHHVSRQCTLCKSVGRLSSGTCKPTSRGGASSEDLPRHLAIAAHGKRRRGLRIQTKSGGTVPSRKIRWCSYEGCNKSMPYLHDHLKNAHGVKPKTTLMRLYLEKARKYEGRKAEMEHNFILKIKLPVPSTSKVTSPKKRPA